MEKGIMENTRLDVEKIYAALFIILVSRAKTNRVYRKLYIAYLENKTVRSEQENGTAREQDNN